MSTESQDNAPVIVLGEGSAAVFLLGQLIQQNQRVIWAGGSGARILPVMPYLKSEKALGTLLQSQKILTKEILPNPVEKGVFHRVFRNKGFKLPAWKRTSSLETQTQAYEEMVWGPEQAFIGVQEYRIADLNPAVVEEGLRAHFENHPLIQKVTGAPILELEIYEHGGKVQFANGLISEFKQFFYCDSLSELKALPKLATVFKHQLKNVRSGNRMSALQVIFQHSKPLKQTPDVGLVIPLNRDSGETFDRDGLGYFMDANHSVWTVFLQPSEIEENHEIMKKLRRVKQSLNKAFDSPEFLPEGCKEFTGTVEKEQFRFEEGYVISEGEIKPSSANEDFVLLTDSLGLSRTLEMIADRFAIAPAEFSLEVAQETASEVIESVNAEVAPVYGPELSL